MDKQEIKSIIMRSVLSFFTAILCSLIIAIINFFNFANTGELLIKKVIETDSIYQQIGTGFNIIIYNIDKGITIQNGQIPFSFTFDIESFMILFLIIFIIAALLIVGLPLLIKKLKKN